MGEPADREAQKPAFQPLSAITLRNDQPIDPDHSRDDLLNFTPLARTIAGIAIGTEGPFTIGITAKWGHGKTSMLRLVKHLIERHGETKGEAWQATHVNVWFNPWQYEGEEQPIAPLLLAIQRAIANKKEEHRSRSERAGAMARGWLNGIWCVLFSALYGLKVKMPGIELDYSKIIDKYEDVITEEPVTSLPVSTVMQVVDALNEISDAREDKLLGGTAEDKPKIIVYIDDLDRCHPDTATKLLDGIKLILNQPGFIFILALDKTIIEEYLIRRYLREFGTSDYKEVGTRYIDKIIQLELPLPPMDGRFHGSSENERASDTWQPKGFLEQLAQDTLGKYYCHAVPDMLRLCERLTPRAVIRHLIRLRTDLDNLYAKREPKIYVKRPQPDSALPVRGDPTKSNEPPIYMQELVQAALLSRLIESAFFAAERGDFLTLCRRENECKMLADFCTEDGPNDSGSFQQTYGIKGNLSSMRTVITGAIRRDEGLAVAIHTYGQLWLNNENLRTELLEWQGSRIVEAIPDPALLSVIASATGEVNRPASLDGGSERESQSSHSSYQEKLVRDAVRQSLGLRAGEWNDDAWLSVTNLALNVYLPDDGLMHIAKCKNIRSLSLTYATVSDQSPLVSLTSLKELSLVNARVSDLSPLANLTSLVELSLAYARVSDVSPLSRLTSLQELDLSYTQVSDVSPLASLTSLIRLNLGSTQVSDVSPLSGLTSLQELDLSYTEVSEEDVAKLRKALPECRINAWAATRQRG